ncbi:MAG: hypothetical protein Kow0092_24150 [Deferrisomatales bacterium]
MSGVERPGRLLVVGYDGAAPPERLFAFARRYGLGGVILFRRNCPDAAAVRAGVTRLRDGLREADPGWRPLILVDQEGGRVERIRDGVPALPAARVLGRQGPRGVARAVDAQARALKALGVDVNLAPVCDVLHEGESGAIGDRSFGEDPVRVAALVAAHVQACRSGGVLPCAKHFPGHGRARVDSHRELPVVDISEETFRCSDLVPFRAALGAGAPLVMVGHLLCPRVSARPATLSPRWIRGVLREDLGFSGAVVSDDMEMGALDRLGTPEALAVEAVDAGCDLLVYGRMLRPELDLEGVAAALGEGVPPARAAEAMGRVAALGDART